MKGTRRRKRIRDARSQIRCGRRRQKPPPRACPLCNVCLARPEQPLVSKAGGRSGNNKHNNDNNDDLDASRHSLGSLIQRLNSYRRNNNNNNNGARESPMRRVRCEERERDRSTTPTTPTHSFKTAISNRHTSIELVIQTMISLFILFFFQPHGDCHNNRPSPSLPNKQNAYHKFKKHHH